MLFPSSFSIRKLSGILLALTVMAINSGCVEREEHYILNPDGSGKVLLTLRGLDLAETGRRDFSTLFGESPLPVGPDARLEAYLRHMAAVAADGVDVWSVPEYGFDVDGSAWVRVTAFFPRLDRLRLDSRVKHDTTVLVTLPFRGCPEIVAAPDGHNTVRPWIQETRQGHQFFVYAPPAASSSGIPSSPDETRWRLANELLRIEPVGRSARRAVKITLSGTQAAMASYEPAKGVADALPKVTETDGVLTLEWATDVGRRQAQLRALLADAAWVEAHPDATLADLLRRLPDPGVKFRPNAAMLFDYAAEVEAARTTGGFVPRIPRLAAGRPLPLTVTQTSMTLAFDRAGTSVTRAFGQEGLGDPPPLVAAEFSKTPKTNHENDYDTPARLTLYGSPIPARSFRVASVVIDEARGSDGRPLADGLSAEGSLANNHAMARKMNPEAETHVAFGWGDTISHVPLDQGDPPGVNITLSGLRLNRARPVIGTLRGKVRFRTNTGFETVQSGPAVLTTDMREALPSVGVGLRHLSDDRKTLRFSLDREDPHFVYIGLFDPAGRTLRPIHESRSGLSFGSGATIQTTNWTFAQPLPETVCFRVVKHRGIRDVEVAFELKDVDLSRPAPPPAPEPDGDLAYIGDEADRADLAERRAAEQARAVDPLTLADLPARVWPRRPARHDLTLGLVAAQFNTSYPLSYDTGFREPVGWKLTFSGAPIPPNAFAVESARLDEIIDRRGYAVRLSADRRTYHDKRVQASFESQPYDYGRPRRAKADSPPDRVILRLPPLDLTMGETGLARLTGMVRFKTYERFRPLPLGAFSLAMPAKGAMPPPPMLPETMADDDAKLVHRIDPLLSHVADHNKYRQFKLLFKCPAEAVQHLSVLDETDAPLSLSAPTEFHYESPEILSAVFSLPFPVPERARITLVLREGLGVMEMPFTLDNIDFDRPGPGPAAAFFLPEPEQEAMGVASTSPAGGPPPLPVALYHARYERSLSAALLDARWRGTAAHGHWTKPGWQLHLYAAPLPERAFMVRSARLLEAITPGGRSALVGSATDNMEMQLYDSPYGREFTTKPELPVPYLTLGLPPLSLRAEETRLARLRGEVIFAAYGHVETLDAGRIELRQNATSPIRNLKLIRMDTDGYSATFELDAAPDEFERLEFRDDAGQPIPVEQYSRHPAHSRPPVREVAVIRSGQIMPPPEESNPERIREGCTVRFQRFGDHSAPLAANIGIVLRRGLHDIRVGFDHADMDFEHPFALPFPDAEQHVPPPKFITP